MSEETRDARRGEGREKEERNRNKWLEWLRGGSKKFN
jgi:hypothetical protein